MGRIKHLTGSAASAFFVLQTLKSTALGIWPTSYGTPYFVRTSDENHHDVECPSAVCLIITGPHILQSPKRFPFSSNKSVALVGP